MPLLIALQAQLQLQRGAVVRTVPIEDFYLAKVVKRADGKFETQIVQKVLEKHADAYASECGLP